MVLRIFLYLISSDFIVVFDHVSEWYMSDDNTQASNTISLMYVGAYLFFLRNA